MRPDTISKSKLHSNTTTISLTIFNATVFYVSRSLSLSTDYGKNSITDTDYE